jgi:hypothetical protein
VSLSITELYTSDQYLVGLDLEGVGPGTLYGVRVDVEDFLVRLTEDLLKGDPPQPAGPSCKDTEPGEVLPVPPSLDPPSPNTVLADLARLALLGVLMLDTGDPNLEELRDFCKAEPILPTFLPIGLLKDNMLDREEILDKFLFFFTSGWSCSMSKLQTEILSPPSVSSISSSTGSLATFLLFLFLNVNLLLLDG